MNIRVSHSLELRYQANSVAAKVGAGMIYVDQNNLDPERQDFCSNPKPQDPKP